MNTHFITKLFLPLTIVGSVCAMEQNPDLMEPKQIQPTDLAFALARYPAGQYRTALVLDCKGKTQLGAVLHMAEIFQQELSKRAGSDIRLSDYFGEFAGANTGSLPATVFALGQPTENLFRILSLMSSRLIIPKWLTRGLGGIRTVTDEVNYYIDRKDPALLNIKNNYDPIKMDAQAEHAIMNLTSGAPEDLKAKLIIHPQIKEKIEKKDQPEDDIMNFSGTKEELQSRKEILKAELVDSQQSEPEKEPERAPKSFFEQVQNAIMESDAESRRNARRGFWDTIVDFGESVVAVSIKAAGIVDKVGIGLRAMDKLGLTAMDKIEERFFKPNPPEQDAADSLAGPTQEAPLFVVKFKVDTIPGKRIETFCESKIEANRVKFTYKFGIPVGVYPSFTMPFQQTMNGIDYSTFLLMQLERFDGAKATNIIIDFLHKARLERTNPLSIPRLFSGIQDTSNSLLGIILPNTPANVASNIPMIQNNSDAFAASLIQEDNASEIQNNSDTPENLESQTIHQNEVKTHLANSKVG